MYTALTKQHLDVGFVRLRVQVINQKNGKVNFLADNHCSNFGITSKRTRVHTFDVSMNPQETEELTAFIREVREQFHLTVFLIEHHMIAKAINKVAAELA